MWFFRDLFDYLIGLVWFSLGQLNQEEASV